MVERAFGGAVADRETAPPARHRREGGRKAAEDQTVPRPVERFFEVATATLAFLVR
jgi:hypothetical protein